MIKLAYYSPFALTSTEDFDISSTYYACIYFSQLFVIYFETR